VSEIVTRQRRRKAWWWQFCYAFEVS